MDINRIITESIQQVISEGDVAFKAADKADDAAEAVKKAAGKAAGRAE